MAEVRSEKWVSSLPTTLQPHTHYYVRVGAGFDHYITNANSLPFRVNSGGAAAQPNIYVPIGGQFLLDPNETNGWGYIGIVDDTVTFKMADATDTHWARTSGGIMFPIDVELVSFDAWHYNSSNSVQPWGWSLNKQTKTEGSAARSNVSILHELNDGNTRDYGDTNNRNTSIDFTGNPEKLIPSGDVFGLGVSTLTTISTNYYVRVMAGMLVFKPV